MITIIEGTVGTGKTALMTLFMYLEGMDGRVLHGNYKMDFCNAKYLEGLGRFKDWPRERCAIAIDEAHSAGFDSRESMSEINKENCKNVTQSRKIGSNMYFTAQDASMIDTRVREIAHCIMAPKIEIYHPESGKPLILKVYFSFHPWKISKFNKVWDGFQYIPLVVDNFDILDHYDTYEVIEAMESPRLKDREKLLEEYAPYRDLTKTELIAKMVMEKDVSEGIARIVAGYLKIGC